MNSPIPASLPHLPRFIVVLRRRGSTVLTPTGEGLFPEVMRRWLRCGPQLELQVRGDLLAVEAAVLNENFVGAGAGNNYACHIYSGDIAFERHRIADRTALIFGKLDAHAAQEVIVRVVANQGHDEVVLQAHVAARCDDDNMVHSDFLY